MKALFRTLIAAAFVFTAAFQAHAQYYEMANQAINMVQPALNGSFNYRGFADVSYTGGIGKMAAIPWNSLPPRALNTVTGSSWVSVPVSI